MVYEDIVASALAYTDKADAVDVIANIDRFLRVVESRVNRILQTRLQSKRARLICDPTVEYYGLPYDYGGLRDVLIIDNDKPTMSMRYLAPEAMNQHVTFNGMEPSYSVVSNQIRVWPLMPTSKQLEIIYYQRLEPISVGRNENWMTRLAPDVYIFGLVVEICAFIKDADAGSLWNDRFKEALAELDADDHRDLWSGPSPTIQLL